MYKRDKSKGFNEPTWPAIKMSTNGQIQPRQRDDYELYVSTRYRVKHEFKYQRLVHVFRVGPY